MKEQHQYYLYKLPRVCMCKDESHYIEKTGSSVTVNPKPEKHYVILKLYCTYCHVDVAEREILIHEGHSDLCDSCNYWAFGLDAPLEFAYIYHDTYLVSKEDGVSKHNA